MEKGMRNAAEMNGTWRWRKRWRRRRKSRRRSDQNPVAVPINGTGPEERRKSDYRLGHTGITCCRRFTGMFICFGQLTGRSTSAHFYSGDSWGCFDHFRFDRWEEYNLIFGCA